MLVVAGLLTAPSLIDWTEYRTTFAAQLGAATGRAVSIDGDLDLVLLPWPAFNADAVRIGGGMSDDFVAIERVSARLAVLPLLRGDLKFQELVLRRPEARITRNAEGAIDFLAVSPRSATSAATPGKRGVDFDINVERLLIDDGVVTFQDTANGTTIDVHGINATIHADPAASLTLAGDLTVGKVPLVVDGALGRVGTGGIRTASLSVTLPEADTKAKLAGTYLTREGELRADVNVSGASTLGFLAGLGAIDAATPMPAAAQKPFSLTAKVRGTASTVTIDPITFDIGGTPAKGSVAWYADAGAPPQMDVKVEIGAVALEAWRFAAVVSPAGSYGFIGTARAQETAVRSNALFAPFKNLSANFDIRAPALSYRGQTLGGGAIKAILANNELTLSDASIELPGATRVSAFGLARLNEDAIFEGALNVQSGDLRNLLAWLGISPDAQKIPPGRLSNATFRAALQGTPARVTLADINATIDTSTISGSVTWARSARANVNLDLTVTGLNADIYAPLVVWPKAAAPAAGAPAPADTYGVKPVFAAFAGLADFDADLRLQIDGITAGGIAGGKAGFDLALKDGALNLRTASFDSVGGATAWFSGNIGGFGVTPRFDNLQFDLSAPDLARVGRAFGFAVPAPLRALMPVSLTGTLNGTLAQTEIAAVLKAANLTLRADGQGLTLDQQPHVTLNLEAAQPSYVALLKAAGMTWPLGVPDPGAVKLAAHLTHDSTHTKVESLDLRVGDNAMAGTIDIDRTQGAPQVTGALTGIALTVDKLWPPIDAARPQAIAAPRAVRGAPPPKPAVKPPMWSEDPLDWSFLKGWRGNIDLSGRALSLRGVQAQDFTFRLAVADDAAEIQSWKGKIFGAPGQLYVRASATPVPQIQGEIAFIGGDLAGVGAALNGGGTSTAKSSGKADFAASFRTQGTSPAALAAGLSGSGTAKITATETGGGVLAGLLGAITAATQLEGRDKAGAIVLESRFSAADGRIKIEDATVASKSYGGAFAGTIDLPRWLVDLSGRLRLEANNPDKPAAVPITVKGALDLPNVTLLPAR